MRNFVTLFIKYRFFFLFSLLASLSLRLIISYNIRQKESYHLFVYKLNGRFHSFQSSALGYLLLKKENSQLLTENAMLRRRINFLEEKQTSFSAQNFFSDKKDTLWNYFPARVVGNSIHKDYNYILLDAGKKNGVRPGSGIINEEGIVGIIFSVTDEFSIASSVLNLNIRIGAKLADNGSFGTLEWNGRDSRFAKLKYIPLHIVVKPGNTVVTSGLSDIFPENIPVGTITTVHPLEGGNFYDITIRLLTNFSRLSRVYIVECALSPERRKTEDLIPFHE